MDALRAPEDQHLSSGLDTPPYSRVVNKNWAPEASEGDRRDPQEDTFFSVQHRVLSEAKDFALEQEVSYSSK